MNNKDYRLVYVAKSDKKVIEPWKLKLKLIARTNESSFKSKEEYNRYVKDAFKRIDAGEEI